MAITKITTPELLDFPNDSTASANTSGTIIPTGVTGDRPTPIDGEFRFNTTLGYVEYWEGSTWLQIADEYITGQPTTCICNYPITATALYELTSNRNDTCGNYNATSEPNVTYVSGGKFGNTASFNGSNSYINVSTDSIFDLGGSGTGFSVSFWIKRNITTYQSILDKQGGTSTAYGWGMNFNQSAGNGYKFLAYNTSDAFFTVQTGSNTTTGNWEHVVGTYNISDTQLRIYFNGILKDTSGAIGTGTSNSDALWIGARSSGGSISYPVDGLMTQVRVFPTALSDAQVVELYNELPCN